MQVEQVFQLANPHVRYLEFDSHGYSIVEVTPARMQMDWHYITDRAQPGAPQSFARAFQVPVGTNQVIPAPGPLGPRI